MITVRQPPFGAVPAFADGFTHASSVMPVDNASDALCATFTIEEVPLNESAPPNPVCPVTRIAPPSVPSLPLPDESMATAPSCSLNDKVRTGPARAAGPSDTTKLIALPGATFVPADGDSLLTWPAAAALLPVVFVPNVRPAPLIAACAAVCVMPMMFGTATVTGGGGAAGAVPARSSTTARFH